LQIWDHGCAIISGHGPIWRNCPLCAAAMTLGYSSDRWLTYKQAADTGGQVRKGEKSVACVF
jgi:hypothetical protein